MDPINVKSKRAKSTGMFMAAVIFALLSVVCSYAQETEDRDAAQADSVPGPSETLSNVVRLQYTLGVRGEYQSQAGLGIVGRPTNTLAFGMPPGSRGLGVSGQQAPQTSRERSTRRKIFGAIVGGVGGLFGGQILGLAIEGGRDAISGPLIGAAVGGVAGGILGYKFLF